MSRMKVLAAGSALGAAILAGSVSAATTGTVGVTSEYMFRGIPSSGGAAVQGSLDWSDAGGFYAGVWGSNIAPLIADGTEVDLYGGDKFKLQEGVEIDLGAIYYMYPETEQFGPASDPDYPEIYGGVNIGNFSAKLFFADKYFNELSAEESAYYLNAAYNFPIKEGLGFKVAVGYSDGDGVDNLFELLDDGLLNSSSETDNYVDYSFSLNKSLDNGFAASFALIGTDIDDNSLGFDDDPKFVVTLSKGFEI